MSLIGSIIGAGATLLGGALSKPKTKTVTAGDNIMSSAAAAVQAGEKYGFNPLTLLPLGGSGYSYTTNSGIGQAFADAGMILGDGITRQMEQAKVTALQQENEKLRKTAEDALARPDQPGVYARKLDPSPLGAAEPSDLRDEESWRGSQRPLRNPDSPISVYDPLTNNWRDLNPLVAKRLDIKDGDAILTSDGENIFGDETNQILNASSVASEVLGQGNTFGGMRGQTDSWSLGDGYDYVTGSGVHAGKPKKPKSRSRNPQGQR